MTGEKTCDREGECAMGLLAEAAQAGDLIHPWITLIVQAGSLGLLAWVVIVTAPAMLAEARKEREARDARFDQWMLGLQTRHDTRSDEVARGQAEVVKSQDRVVKAINLQTGIIKGALSEGFREVKNEVAMSCKFKIQAQ
jgi:hypothetical protein